MKTLAPFLRAVLVAALAIVPHCLAQPSKQPCKAFTGFASSPAEVNGLHLELGLKKGRLVAARLAFSPSAQFRDPHHYISQAEAERLLTGDLNEAFASMPQFYWFGLTNTAQKMDQAGKLNDAATNAIRGFSGGWEQFCNAFMDWTKGLKLPAIQIGPALSKYFSRLPDLGPILIDDEHPASSGAKDGVLTLTVADPIAAWVDPEVPATKENQSKVDIKNSPASDSHIHEIVSVLRPLQGRLWRRKEIVNLLEDYYFPQGFTQPLVDLTPAQDTPRTVTITESVRIAQILVCPASLKEPAAEMVLYDLLTTEDFLAFRACGEPFNQVRIPTACRAFDYSSSLSCAGHPAGSPAAGPLLNQNVLQAQEAELAKLGFAMTASAAAGTNMVDLVVQQNGASANATSGKVPPVPAPAAAQAGSLAAAPVAPASGLAPIAPIVPIVPKGRPGAAADDEPLPSPQTLRNFLGGEVDYLPGQGVRPSAIYNRVGLFGNDSLTAQAGANGKALSELSYSSDYAFFGSLHRRLSLQLTGSSDFQEKRFLLGAATDERSTGAQARASLELFRKLRQTQLQVFLEARQTRVMLSPAGQNQLTTNLSTLDAGADFILDHSNGLYGRRLELTPDLRFGVGLSPSEPTYQTGALTGSFQQNLPRLFQLHFSGVAKTASGGTPIFELPSFGGEETVRGFRADDGLGRRLLSLQSELWSPLPYFTNNSGKIGQFLHQNVWLAGFADAGGTFQAVDRFSGVREGAGLGARANYRLVTFKADWAYGIGAGRTGEGHGRFYFSVTNWLPL